MECYIIDGKRMKDKKQAHEYLQRVLILPEYYGRNLDALNDCLSEFKKDSVITIINANLLKENLQEYGQTLLQVFIDNASKVGFQLKIEEIS